VRFAIPSGVAYAASTPGAVICITVYCSSLVGLPEVQRPRRKHLNSVITSLAGSTAASGQAHKNGYTIALMKSTPRAECWEKKFELDYYDASR
jgi:hypothetical protein